MRIYRFDGTEKGGRIGKDMIDLTLPLNDDYDLANHLAFCLSHPHRLYRLDSGS